MPYLSQSLTSSYQQLYSNGAPLSTHQTLMNPESSRSFRKAKDVLVIPVEISGVESGSSILSYDLSSTETTLGRTIVIKEIAPVADPGTNVALTKIGLMIPDPVLNKGSQFELIFETRFRDVEISCVSNQAFCMDIQDIKSETIANKRNQVRSRSSGISSPSQILNIRRAPIWGGDVSEVTGDFVHTLNDNKIMLRGHLSFISTGVHWNVTGLTIARCSFV
jgi:hypothetical protein